MDITKSKPRKRNIHRSEEELRRDDKMPSSDVIEDSQDSDGTGEWSLFKALIPKTLRQCIIGEEKDLTQNMVLVPAGEKDDTPQLPQSCNNVYSSSSCPRVSETDMKNNVTSSSSAGVAAESDVDDTSDTGLLNVSYNTCTTVSSNSDASNLDSEYDYETSDNAFSFLTFRLSYLFVTLVVMLADGLQGK